MIGGSECMIVRQTYLTGRSFCACVNDVIVPRDRSQQVLGFNIGQFLEPINFIIFDNIYVNDILNICYISLRINKKYYYLKKPNSILFLLKLSIPFHNYYKYKLKIITITNIKKMN